MKSVGTQLREARQALGWTLKAAAKATKIREDQLQKMEADDFARFHAPAYVRGFVKNYGRVLGLNVRNLNEQLNQVLEVEGEITYQRSGGINYVPELAKTQREFNPRNLSLAAVGLLLLVFLVPFTLRIVQVLHGLGNSIQLADADEPANKSADKKLAKTEDNDKAKSSEGTAATNPLLETAPTVTVAKALPVSPSEGGPATAPKTPAIASTAAASAPAAPVAPAVPEIAENKLTLMAKEECWVRVSILENNQTKNIFEGLIQPGASQDFQPAAKYLIKAGNPSAIEVSLNGKSYATNHSDDHLPAEFSVPSGDTN